MQISSSPVGFTAKEKAFIGTNCRQVIKTDFSDAQSNADPNPAIWGVITDGGSTVDTNLYELPYPFVRITAGGSGGNDSMIYSGGPSAPLMFCPPGAGTDNLTSLHMKCRFLIDDLTGEGGIGFTDSNGNDVPDFNDGTRHPCCLYFNNDVVEVNSSDGTIEDTTVTGDIANGVLSTLEIDIISTSVTFTIDGVVVATHSTRRPDRVLQFMAGSRNTNSIAPQMEISYVEVWGVE